MVDKVTRSGKHDNDERLSEWLLNPKPGKPYRCKVWVNIASQLIDNAYLGPFF